MKVLLTADNIGGVWTFAIEMARGLKQLDVDVVLAVIGEPLTAIQKQDLEGISFHHFLARQEWMENPWEDVYSAGQWLFWLKQRENPDVIHLSSYTLACVDWQIPVTLTIHSCVLSWWEAVKNETAPSSWDTYRGHVKAGIQSADFVTAPSNYMMQVAEKHYGPFRSQKVIYNSRDNSPFWIDNKEKIVFSMGRLWDEAKNIRLLIKAAEEIKYPVFIAGEIDKKAMASVPVNISFLGHLTQQEVATWLSKAWIYALPAKYEPFGYSFLEAAYSGCALVGGDISSLHEIWDDAMIYTPTDNPGQLAKIINGMLDNQWQLNHLSIKAHKRSLERYNQNRMALEYFSLYKKIISYKSNLLHH